MIRSKRREIRGIGQVEITYEAFAEYLGIPEDVQIVSVSDMFVTEGRNAIRIKFSDPYGKEMGWGNCVTPEGAQVPHVSIALGLET
jgi:hypothetical protein